MTPSSRLFDPNEQAGWLAIVGWRKFQHYHDRRPIWIKTYLDLLERDEYLDLTPTARAVLHGLWLMTARRPSVNRLSTSKLSRALNMRVTSQHLTSLRDAGFIDFCSSKTDAELVQNRSTEVEVEIEKERAFPLNGQPKTQTVVCPECGVGGASHIHASDCSLVSA